MLLHQVYIDRNMNWIFKVFYAWDHFNKAKPGQLSQYLNVCYQLLKSVIIDSSVLNNFERLSKNEQTIVLGYYAIRISVCCLHFSKTRKYYKLSSILRSK